MIHTQDDVADVLRLRQIEFAAVATLLSKFGLQLLLVEENAPIPGSYWGDDEAGIIGTSVYARASTPVHSILHEAGHLIVLPPDERAAVHTDATDSIEEENGVCVLQALMADALPGVGRSRILADMDTWGYTFRLGSAQAYIEQDAADAWAWLVSRGLANTDHQLVIPTLATNSAIQVAGQ